MNSNNSHKYWNNIALWKTGLIKNIMVVALSSMLLGCWPDSKKAPPSQDKKNFVDTTQIIAFHKQKLHTVLKDTLDFKNCLSYDDLLYALEAKKYVTTIDPEAIFEKDSAFFAKAKITKEYFLQAYYNSNIVRDAIYTKKFHKTIDDTSMAILQEKLLEKTWSAKYIHKDINVPVIDSVIQVLQKKEKPPKHPKPPIIEANISRNSIVIKGKYGRREAYDILQKYKIGVRSSKKWSNEKGNNKSTGRTCLHDINIKTIDMLGLLALDMEKRFTPEIYNTYRPITVTWWTEHGHALSKKFPTLTHASWAKADVAITLLIALYFHEKWISTYQVKTKEKPEFEAIPCTIGNIPTNVIAHDKHYDFLVK